MRRALRDAGFLVSKVQGFGGKREMTVASLRPGMGRRPPADRVAATGLLLGGGPEGAGLAPALALHGRPVPVLDPAFPEERGPSPPGPLAAALRPAPRPQAHIHA